MDMQRRSVITARTPMLFLESGLPMRACIHINPVAARKTPARYVKRSSSGYGTMRTSRLVKLRKVEEVINAMNQRCSVVDFPRKKTRNPSKTFAAVTSVRVICRTGSEIILI